LDRRGAPRPARSGELLRSDALPPGRSRTHHHRLRGGMAGSRSTAVFFLL
jgi:hypothetical protein